MVGARSDRARARARHLLATLYPVPGDAGYWRLRELALRYLEEADRLEAEQRGCEPLDITSAALDTVARDYFARELAAARSAKKR